MEKYEYDFTVIRKRISWGSVMAGVLTVLAVSVLLSILATSISLFMLDPQSSDPASGIGTMMGIWTALSLIISLAAGGFIAGKLAGNDGVIHGFLTWAATLIITVILAIIVTIGAVKLTSNILGAVSSATGSILSGAGSLAGEGVSALGDKVGDVFGNIDFNDEGDRQEMRKDVRDALRKSGVKEFQPEYIQRQMRAVKSDFNRSVKRIATHPNDAENIIDGFTDRLKKRADNYAQNINRDDLSRAIANNSDLSKAEADRVVDEYMEVIDNGKQQLNNLEQNIEQAKQDWEETKQKALEEADKATNAAARSALISFFALLIGAAVCCYCSLYGTRITRRGYEV